MRRAVLALFCVLTLSGCMLSRIASLAAGGPDVADDGQIGKTNNRTLGQNNVTDLKIGNRVEAQKIVQSSDKSDVKADQVEAVVVHNLPEGFFVWLAVAVVALVVWSIFLWQLPAPERLKERWRQRYHV